ncbi:MAG: hypothetical protein K0U84_17820, partial [Actinomycetia bacterium]|nr:hypothetical protein [Actinomycetes bacterium]
MDGARYIGWAGSLAVALGIAGVGVTAPAAGWADTGDSRSGGKTSESSGSAGTAGSSDSAGGSSDSSDSLGGSADSADSLGDSSSGEGASVDAAFGSEPSEPSESLESLEPSESLESLVGEEAVSGADGEALDEGLGDEVVDGVVEVVSEVEQSLAPDDVGGVGGVGDEGEDQRGVEVSDGLDGGGVADPGSSGADGPSAVTDRARGSVRFSAAVDEVPPISAAVAGSDPGVVAAEAEHGLSMLEGPDAAEVGVSAPAPAASTATDPARPEVVVMLHAAASEPGEIDAVALRPFVAPGTPSVPVPSPAPLAAVAWHRREAEQTQLNADIDAAAG